LKLIWYCSCH